MIESEEHRALLWEMVPSDDLDPPKEDSEQEPTEGDEQRAKHFVQREVGSFPFARSRAASSAP